MDMTGDDERHREKRDFEISTAPETVISLTARLERD
jgi:hypothetical protein